MIDVLSGQPAKGALIGYDCSVGEEYQRIDNSAADNVNIID